MDMDLKFIFFTGTVNNADIIFLSNFCIYEKKKINK